MAIAQTPLKILVADDESTVGTALQAEFGDAAKVTALHPQELEERDLLGRQLVLLDLRLEVWPERDNLPFACQVHSGLGLAALLKDHLKRKKSQAPVAFALHSGHPGDLSLGHPTELRNHVLAAAHDLEWVFYKDADRLHSQVLSLAEAVALLPQDWSPDDFAGLRDSVESLLGLSQSEWRDSAWLEIEQCHPPIHNMSSHSHGLAFVRWMLHRILPYPCFLMDASRLAIRLRLDPMAVKADLQDDGSELSMALLPFRYTGILKDFQGKHWWRPGVDAFVWNITAGRPFDLRLLHERLEGIAGHPPARLEAKDSVQCLDVDLRPTEPAVPVSAAVRIQPDDWPAYAEPAWVLLGDVREHPRLRALVVEDDREKAEI